MYKLKKTALAVLTAVIALSASYCVLGEEAVDLNGKNIRSYEGKVTEVLPYYENEKPSEDKSFLYMTVGETEEGEENIVSFLVTGETERLNELELAPGAVAKVYYDGSLPVILIYPPRYDAVAIEVLEESDGEPAKTEEAQAALPPVGEPAENREEQEMSVLVNGETVAVQYYVDDNGVAMIPVRVVCEALGYDVNWVGEEKKVEIGVAISMIIGKDEYIYARMAPFNLGYAPVLIEGVTFAPISFFSDVMRLDCAYAIGGPVTIDESKTEQEPIQQ